MKRAPESLLDDIAQFIDQSNEIIGQGAFAELKGLDDKIRRLCEEVLDLSEEERKTYADRLQTLLAGLQQLGDSMAQARDDVAAEIRSLSSHQKANVAYRTVEDSDRDGKKPKE